MELLMDIKATIVSAGRNLNTVIITTLEEDGSMVSREIEPYGYRHVGNNDVFICYDILSQRNRSFSLSKIISAHKTSNAYEPRIEIDF